MRKTVADKNCMYEEITSLFVHYVGITDRRKFKSAILGQYPMVSLVYQI
jgi:hypothetical protein